MGKNEIGALFASFYSSSAMTTTGRCGNAPIPLGGRNQMALGADVASIAILF